METIEIINGIFAIIYFFAWTIGFYFQIYITYKAKTGDGVCINFQILSMTGMLFFAIYNTYFVITKVTNFETIIDMLLAQVGFVLAIVILFQTFFYKRKRNFLNSSTIFSILFIFFLILFYFFFGIEMENNDIHDFYLFLGFTQSVICIQKYFSQIELNFFNKSVESFSIEGIFGDLTGGLLMILQFFLNSVFLDGFEINFPKLSLAVISIFFDVVIIFQKYYYRRKIKALEKFNNEKIEEKESIFFVKKKIASK